VLVPTGEELLGPLLFHVSTQTAEFHYSIPLYCSRNVDLSSCCVFSAAVEQASAVHAARRNALFAASSSISGLKFRRSGQRTRLERRVSGA